MSVEDLWQRAALYAALWLAFSFVALIDNFVNGVSISQMSWIDKLICGPAIVLTYPFRHFLRKEEK